MKKKPEIIYTKIALTAFCVIAASLLFYFLLFKSDAVGAGLKKLIEVLNPIIYGFIIAYILNPPMQFFENTALKLALRMGKHPKKRGLKVIRIVSTIITTLLVIHVEYALIALLIPELIKSIKNIITSFPNYVNNIQSWINTTFNDKEFDNNTNQLISSYAEKLETWFQNEMTPQINNVIKNITSSLLNLLLFFKNVFLGLIVSMYVLISKEMILSRFRRFNFAAFPVPTANRIIKNLRFVDEKFGGFLIGKIIDSIIIGLLCYIGTELLRLPYSLLVSVVVGVTNVIPFFGPFIGAIPSAILIFVVNPLQALYFIIFVFALQQFDGNYLGPKILGNSVGVSSFMVLVAIMIGGGFMGVFGMIIGVPVCAVITALIQSFVLRRVVKKKLPGDLESYHHIDRIDPESRKVVNNPDAPSGQSLYDAIKYKNKKLTAMEAPLEEKPWDKTEDDVRKEEAFSKAEKAFEKDFKEKNEE